MEELKVNAYKSLAIENRDFSKIDKIIKGIENKKINKENLYDYVRKFTKTVTSDHSINRWQIIADWFYKNI